MENKIKKTKHNNEHCKKCYGEGHTGTAGR